MPLHGFILADHVDHMHPIAAEAKLQRMPPEKEMARNVVVVIGAGNGIGKAVAHRVAKERAHVVCAYLDLKNAQATADELTKIYGMGIGVAGTDISRCGPAIGLAVNITDRASIKSMLEQVVLAYDTSKAAVNHLIRELAIGLSPLVRVNGLAPTATVVEGSSMFPRDRVVDRLTRYELALSQDEETETLREKLSEFYAQRTLTKDPIRLADQAEAAYLLASTKLSKTTGQILAVDGGQHEAFLHAGCAVSYLAAKYTERRQKFAFPYG